MTHATTSELVDERAQEDVLIVRLLLLHGFTATGRSWDGVRRRIDGGTYSEVLAPDLRGHGEAAARTPATIPAVLDDLRQDEAYALAGYSMGGRVALHLALAQPDLVRRLVLVSTTPGDRRAVRARRAAPIRRGPRRGHRARRRRGVRPLVGGPAALRRPAAGGRGRRPRRPAAQHRRGSGRVAARDGHGADDAGVGPAGGADDAGTRCSSASATRSSARSASAWSSACRTPSSSSSPGPATPSTSRRPTAVAAAL